MQVLDAKGNGDTRRTITGLFLRPQGCNATHCAKKWNGNLGDTIVQLIRASVLLTIALRTVVFGAISTTHQ